ncbi:MAG TPA: YbjN domain-containing protein [Solimonas sp.]|nr:YbjN domain-containing protein [Solimonas sp.]
MSTEMRAFVTPADIADILRKAGYRATVVEHDKFPQVQSAAQGLGFFISFGNGVPGSAGTYVDFSYHCWISIQGELPEGLIETWNQSRRFARLFRQGQLLVLTMDVVVAGGVSEPYLAAQAELWDRVIHDFLHHVKRPAAAQSAAA